MPDPLAPSRVNSCLRNALLNPLTPLRLIDAFLTQCSFDLSSSSHQVDSQHPHSFPTQCLFNLHSSCIKSIPDVSSVSQLQCTESSVAAYTAARESRSAGNKTEHAREEGNTPDREQQRNSCPSRATSVGFGQGVGHLPVSVT